jgi:Holliday junction DNA helicase RuvA
MIARIRGRLWHKSPQEALVDVNGVGYRLMIPLTTFYDLPAEGEQVEFRVYTCVREDALHLYGFLTEAEKELFMLLIGVSKIGPKTGLSIISGLPTERLREAIHRQDIGVLASIPGIGRKTAERLALELRGKVAPAGGEAAPVPSPPDEARMSEDVVNALVNLGYRKKDAERAFRQVWDSGERSIEAFIRKSLARLAP